MRWPSGPVAELEWFEQVLHDQRDLIIDGLSLNIIDNRTGVSDMSTYCDILSDIDLLDDIYTPSLLRGATYQLPRGQKNRVRYPKFTKKKEVGILLEAAITWHTSMKDIRERMEYIDPFLFQVFDLNYQKEHDMSVSTLRIMNHKIRAMVRYN